MSKKRKKECKDQELINQVSHLTQDTLWESDKSTGKRHIKKRLEVSPCPAGDHKAAKHRQGNMSKTNTNKIKRTTKDFRGVPMCRQKRMCVQLSAASTVFHCKVQLFRKNLSGIPSECQTDWIQIRPNVLSDLIWVQSVCKSYQQTTLSRQ